MLPCPWDFPGKNTGLGCHALLQGIRKIQGSNVGLLHWSRFFTVWATREAQETLYSETNCLIFLSFSFLIYDVQIILPPWGSFEKLKEPVFIKYLYSSLSSLLPVHPLSPVLIPPPFSKHHLSGYSLLSIDMFPILSIGLYLPSLPFSDLGTPSMTPQQSGIQTSWLSTFGI